MGHHRHQVVTRVDERRFVGVLDDHLVGMDWVDRRGIPGQVVDHRADDIDSAVSVEDSDGGMNGVRSQQGGSKRSTPPPIVRGIPARRLFTACSIRTLTR